MARSTGEMPFLEHLEELRVRILKSLAAVVVGVAAGIFLVDRLQLVHRLQAPILPLLEGRNLVIQSPTEPVLIWLKLGLIVGLVLASPVIIWQAWAFLAPALYEREKKAIVPSLFVGMALFVLGASLSFIFIVPQALRVLLSFQAGAFEILITFDKYFGFVLQVVLAMGLSAELPLLIIVLAALGVVTPAMLKRFRRFAVVLSFVAGALLSPGGDIFSMLMMTVPLLLLYEIGVIGAHVIHRRRLKAQAAASSIAVALLLALAPVAEAQRPPPRPPPRPPAQAQDTLRDTTRAAGPIDTASAKRMGIPSAPKLTFPQTDSIIDELLELEGYETTRYRADTAEVHAIDRRVELESNAMTERTGSTLEANRIGYREGDCRFEAQGEPHLFQEGTVVVGDSLKYDTCVQRGLVREGLTTFPQQGANWFIRGHIAMDSSSSRIYASAKEVTSCDLPDSHYHFSARELKWVSKSMMVARPAVLYVRDVPIAWIPFLFQDTKRGRRSGILIPEFGFNDIVRPSRNYNRTIKNIGYYWAASDYFDLLARFDWFSNRYTELGFEGQYRWINRFVQGAISFTRSKEAGGGTNSRIVWNHNQQFNNTTRLRVALDYTTNSRIVFRNTVDPRLSTQNIRSSANLSKQYKWGNLALGFTRSQNVSDNSGTQTLPSLSISPKPFDFGPNVTWSPDLNFTNDQAFKQPFRLLVSRGPGLPLDTLSLTGSSRVSRFTLNTPLRVGDFNWTNSVSMIDTDSTGLREDEIMVPDESTPDPTDSVTIRRIRSGGFGSSFDWDTGINLPILFRTSWKATPSVRIVNTTSGDFAIRNERTGGQWVTQGKRLEFGLSMAPTFYGFFGGIGPFERIRHTIQPSISYAYSPSASVPLEYARAVARRSSPLELRSLARQAISLTLNQNFEAKTRRPPGDTTDNAVKKIRLLSISTSGLSYDLEQAKQPGRTGWTTSSITNSFLSDLVSGFNLSVTHDLWRGNVGTDSAEFSPFLSNVTASFSLTGETFKSIGRLFGLVSRPAEGDTARGRPGAPAPTAPNPFSAPMDDFRRGSAFTSNQTYVRGSRGFTANVNYTMSRSRPRETPQGLTTLPTQSNISLQTSFAPTRFWQVNWTTQYNATENRFEAQQLNLTRDLHDWRATFSFSRVPQGNFAFSFLITLIDLPDIKFDYRQTSIEQRQ